MSEPETLRLTGWFRIMSSGTKYVIWLSLFGGAVGAVYCFLNGGGGTIEYLSLVGGSFAYLCISSSHDVIWIFKRGGTAGVLIAKYILLELLWIGSRHPNWSVVSSLGAIMSLIALVAGLLLGPSIRSPK